MDFFLFQLYLRRYGYLIDHMPSTEILASTTNREEAMKYVIQNKFYIRGDIAYIYIRKAGESHGLNMFNLVYNIRC